MFVVKLIKQYKIPGKKKEGVTHPDRPASPKAQEFGKSGSVEGMDVHKTPQVLPEETPGADVPSFYPTKDENWYKENPRMKIHIPSVYMSPPSSYSCE